MIYPTIGKELREKLEVIRYLARDEKYETIRTDKLFREVSKDFKRILKMRALGRELKQSSYKRLMVSHLRYGTDAWEIRISASRSTVGINSTNWAEFKYWVERLESYAPNSPRAMMEYYPHIKVNE